jgi:hypothetical protein
MSDRHLLIAGMAILSLTLTSCGPGTTSMFRADPPVAESASPLWADPVECLLDLLELRLNEQASALLDHLIAGAKA